MDLRSQAPLPGPLKIEALWLLLAGVGADLSGSVAGLASIVTFPTLLAVGLPPGNRHVTNTIALFGVTRAPERSDLRDASRPRREVPQPLKSSIGREGSRSARMNR